MLRLLIFDSIFFIAFANVSSIELCPQQWQKNALPITANAHCISGTGSLIPFPPSKVTEGYNQARDFL